MAETTTDTAATAMNNQTTAADLDGSGPANIAPAETFSTSGAPVQIVPGVDPDHPAIDNNPRANTTVAQNAIDMNDPVKTGAEIVDEQTAAASKKKA